MPPAQIAITTARSRCTHQATVERTCASTRCFAAAIAESALTRKSAPAPGHQSNRLLVERDAFAEVGEGSVDQRVGAAAVVQVPALGHQRDVFALGGVEPDPNGERAA